MWNGLIVVTTAPLSKYQPNPVPLMGLCGLIIQATVGLFDCLGLVLQDARQHQVSAGSNQVHQLRRKLDQGLGEDGGQHDIVHGRLVWMQNSIRRLGLDLRIHSIGVGGINVGHPA